MVCHKPQAKDRFQVLSWRLPSLMHTYLYQFWTNHDEFLQHEFLLLCLLPKILTLHHYAAFKHNHFHLLIFKPNHVVLLSFFLRSTHPNVSFRALFVFLVNGFAILLHVVELIVLQFKSSEKVATRGKKLIFQLNQYLFSIHQFNLIVHKQLIFND